MEEEVGNIIEVMPISLANKIAAGEVVQRPASVVKELVENALDAGANDIVVHLKEAGSVLIQVVDNGCGMTPQDARMCFTRHATSKIKTVDDLENIHTLGFRGEALASIASVAQVELVTGQNATLPGFKIRIDGGEFVEEGPAAPVRGSSISVRNLFYNIPARRNFLKRPPTELKHILDMIEVLALSHPEVGFKVEQDRNSLIDVSPGNLDDRWASLQTRAMELTSIPLNTDLIRVEESTSYLAVRGLLGPPNSAKRTRGHQFLFVNGRSVKHRYIEHAVLSAFEYVLPEGSYPFFVLFLDIDPRHVDVNVHPTKAEVKFDDERGVYGMLRAVVRRALGMTLKTPDMSASKPLLGMDLGLAPFFDADRSSYRSKTSYTSEPTASWGLEATHALLKGAITVPAPHAENKIGRQGGVGEEGLLWQLHDTYILTQIRSGLVIIDQQAAHERILFEQASSCLEEGFGLSQQLLFPRKLSLSAADFALLQDLVPDMKRLGFDVEMQSSNSVIIKGVPADIATGDERGVLDELIDQYRLFERVEKLSGRENLARSMARRGAVRAGNKLSPKEMRSLIDQLFECQYPYVSPDGRPTMITLSGEELRERFDKR
ncbi:MAG: DNA mismatch repair endonuclease MutL [Bacteroidetes bacterium]|nr:DNA mismatch repair endonuclease MutL [Bacteroidota bacterium]